MSDSKKTDLPDLPEKIEPQATEFKEESLAPIRIRGGFYHYCIS